MIEDHLGNKYKNREEMCNNYGISVSLYKHRTGKQKMSKKEALTLPPERRKYFFNGKYYSSYELAKITGLTANAIQRRVRNGMTIEEACSTPLAAQSPKAVVIDHKGNIYKNTKEMCEAYGKKPSNFHMQKRLGRSTKEILEGVYSSKTKWHYKGKQKTQDHLGTQYPSISAMCKTWNINRKVFLNRIKSGWSTEDALTTPSNLNIFFNYKHLFDINGTRHYGCTCKLCKQEAIMTSQEMIEHSKTHEYKNL